MNKGLIIQTRPGVGDLCMFLPYIQQIKEHNKDFAFTLVTKKRTAAKQILKYDQSINQIVYLEDETIATTKSKINNFFKLLNFIKKNNFSKIYIMHFSIFWFLLAKISGIKNIYKYGILKKNVDIHLNALEQNKRWLQDPNLSSQTKIIYPQNNSKNNNQIIIGIGSSGPTKKWPTENYIELIKKINNKNIKFYLAGGNNEIENQIANKIINEIKENRIESLCSLSIEEIMPIINSSKLYIGNDTGFMHLSAGLNIPAIGLFGDTPLSYAKYNKNIFPIIPENFKTVGHGSMAMNQITISQVLNEVKKFI
ncbi:RfaF ADP-heptose,LPS heptosyltransferase [Candidatus Pelagibacterales bacterium]|jgi:heptosyltransferase-2